MILELLMEAFRNEFYKPLKHVGNILVFKLSKPLKVNHLGKIHTTDIICLNTDTNMFSGGMEDKGDVKIPPPFAFVFQVPVTRGHEKAQGIEKFKYYMNSKGYFSTKDIKDGTNTFIPKIDTTEKIETKLAPKSVQAKQFKIYKTIPTIQQQKDIILKYAPQSEVGKIFFINYAVSDNDSYEDRSCFSPIRHNIHHADIAADYDKQKIELLMSNLAYKKIIGGKVYLWSLPANKNIINTFIIDGMSIRHIVGDSLSRENIYVFQKKTRQFDLEDSQEEKIDPSKTQITLKSINNIAQDSPEEVERFKAERAKKKQEEDEIQAKIKADLEKMNQPKPKRKLEID